MEETRKNKIPQEGGWAEHGDLITPEIPLSKIEEQADLKEAAALVAKQALEASQKVSGSEREVPLPGSDKKLDIPLDEAVNTQIIQPADIPKEADWYGILNELIKDQEDKIRKNPDIRI